ncbi:DUF4280 domain-containing protein [Lacrimispora sp.]|uniref:DUF4280 domain-containing protein n=1 Tax=Lacrimispora sp. TaxID=2719234 RepID=UPI0028572908|nr:DUF4280 domain-containing protein [Lacrimispora sp.]MDR7810496.1 DUF4280 domain-containing protein [Lacrimispora sp.]
MEEKEILKQMAASQTLQNTASEYVVRGAMIKCSNGEKAAVLNLPEDHGAYIQGQPQINVQDSKTANIHGFGTCKMTDKKCTPELSTWLNGSNENQMFDKNTLKYESAVPFRDSYCICMRQGGIVEPINSGQVIRNPVPKRVYITNDRTAIVANNIRFQIYDPTKGVAIGPVETWETILECEKMKTEFDVVKAILGYSFNIEDLSREELSIDEYGTEWTKQNKPKPIQDKKVIIPTVPGAGSSMQQKVNIMYGFQAGMDILKNIANAIERTYVNFYFERSSLGKHRVTILAGTQSEFWKYYNYEFFDRDRSFVYDVCKQVNSFMSYKALNDYFQFVTEQYRQAIKNGKSRAKLLVQEEELQLKKKEHYDLIINLNFERKIQRFQVYLFSREKKMSQKLVTLPHESIAIVKRIGYGGKITKLIELIDATVTTEGNDKFWELMEKALEDANDKKTKIKLADLSD